MSRLFTLDAFYEAAFQTDHDFNIVDCNARAVEILRTPSIQALHGRNAADLPFEHELSAEFPTYLRERLTVVPFVVIEARVRRDDKTTFWAEIVTHRLDDGAYLVTLRDISARIESLQHAEAANERLRAMLRDRMEFVSNVSHELRTPLTSMSYALANLNRGICGILSEKAIGYIERLRVDVNRLMATVHDLLDLRQLENGTLTLHCTHTPLHHLLKTSVKALAIQAEMKQQTFRLEAIDTELYGFVDRQKLERVFFNILANAVKYTPEYGTITARLYRQENVGVIEVDDNGIGISSEDLPRVSQRYFRVGSHVTGTGLGLSIVRELTELHHGTFAITSPVPQTSQGTRITLTLPLCAPPTTYIVADDPIFTETLSVTLRPLGHHLQTVTLNDILKERLTATVPMNFIFDGDLSQSTVVNAICTLRRLPTFAQSPIIILTDSMDTPMRNECERWRTSVRSRSISAKELSDLLAY